jgi:hypothetical protein
MQGEVIHRVDVTGKTERELEKLERAYLLRVDTSRCFVDIKEVEGE